MRLFGSGRVLQSGKQVLPRVAVGEGSAVFELAISPVFSHYKHVSICLLRNCFQTFRPLLITMAMGNALKLAAFAFQFPVSFYSVFFFEVFYGIMQLAVSFVFVCLFHNNIMFRRVLPRMTGHHGLLRKPAFARPSSW